MEIGGASGCGRRGRSSRVGGGGCGGLGRRGGGDMIREFEVLLCSWRIG